MCCTAGAKEKHTVLHPLASGQYAFDWLLQVRISILLPPSAGGMYQTVLSPHYPHFPHYPHKNLVSQTRIMQMAKDSTGPHG